MNAIDNKKQLDVTLGWISEFKSSLQNTIENGDEGNALKHELFVNANKAMISDLQEQVNVYLKTRRNRIDLRENSETAIFNALIEVEKIGADIRLTNACILLNQAAAIVSDLIDEQIRALAGNGF